MVKDLLSLKPIYGVHISDIITQKNTISNEQGLAKLPLSSKSKLQLSAIGYKTVVISYTKLKKEQFTILLIPQNYKLDEIDVVVDVLREDTKEQAVSFDILKSKNINFGFSATSADILEKTGKISVQKTQAGGGSPIIRGFEANKILLVVDGVRMNNAIYRSGHLQNSITIDRNALENVELIYGAGSVIYGSDALGGVIHYHTIKPQFSATDSLKISNFVKLGASSALNSTYGSYRLNFSTQKWANVLQFTANSYGDIKGGSKQNNYKSYDNPKINWTEIPYYAENFGEGKDSMLLNPNPLIQKRVGYKQYDLLYKSAYKLNTKSIINANVQYSTSTNIQRIDKLNDYKDDVLKYADFYYGPQKRLLTSVNLAQSDILGLELSQINVAWQNIEESRISRKFNNINQLNQIEELNIFSINQDAKKYFNSKNTLYFGSEMLLNLVSSNAYYKELISNLENPAQTRYPDGGSKTFSAAAYADMIHIFNLNWQLNTGIRFSYNYLNSQFKDTTFAHFPFSEIKMLHFMPSTSLNLKYKNHNWQFLAIQSSGYRTPNVDDYGKIRAKNGEITMPNKNLKPEFTWHSELAINYFSDNVNIDLQLFNDFMWQAIVRANGTLNGSDSILYDGDYNHIIINTNADKARIYGIAGGINKTFPINSQQNIQISTSGQWIKGLNLTKNEALGHIPPFLMRGSVDYGLKNWNWGTEFQYNAQKTLSDMSPYGEDNEEESTTIGYPSWWILNTYTQFTIKKELKIALRIENIFNYRYKTFASGLAAPGRNFLIDIIYNK